MFQTGTLIFTTSKMHVKYLLFTIVDCVILTDFTNWEQSLSIINITLFTISIHVSIHGKSTAVIQWCMLDSL